MAGIMGPIICSALLLIWWLTASRARAWERIIGLLGLVAVAGAVYPTLDASMQSPAPLLIWSVPVGVAAFGLALCLRATRSSGIRTRSGLVAGLIAFAASALVRSDGMWGDAAMQLAWRWTATAEERFLAYEFKRNQDPAFIPTPSEQELGLASPEWPGFRGPDRLGRQRGTRFDPNWNQNPPELIWKTIVGPGWSSFAVAGPLLFTQEQRGPDECVVCYSTKAGVEVWSHRIETRFMEAIGGPGPRATPQLAGGFLYALGANGDLIKLNPLDGSLLWRTQIAETAERKPPTWGYSSSPLVIGEHVIVHAGGGDQLGTLAFNTESGNLAWSAPAGDHSYASPQPAHLGGKDTVIMATNAGFKILDPATGAVWVDYEWPHRGYRALQPHVLEDDSIIVATEGSTGSRRILVTTDGTTFNTEFIWSTRNLKADFNDFVVYQDHIYGFDGGLFACVSVETGDRRWKDGRYGKGQVLLLEDSGLLLVSSEQGHGVLLQANPEQHTELAKVPLISGKTWNHPVVVGDRLYIRNGETAACYRLALTTNPDSESEPEP